MRKLMGVVVGVEEKGKSQKVVVVVVGPKSRQQWMKMVEGEEGEYLNQLRLTQLQLEEDSHSNYNKHLHRIVDMLLVVGYNSYCSNCYRLHNHSRLLLDQMQMKLAGCSYCNDCCTVQRLKQDKIRVFNSQYSFFFARFLSLPFIAMTQL